MVRKTRAVVAHDQAHAARAGRVFGFQGDLHGVPGAAAFLRILGVLQQVVYHLTQLLGVAADGGCGRVKLYAHRHDGGVVGVHRAVEGNVAIRFGPKQCM